MTTQATLSRPAPRASVRPIVRREPDTANAFAIYLRDIGEVPLLTAADEVRLACDIEVGLLAAERLGSERPLTDADRRDLQVLVEQGQRSKDVLVESNLRLVVALAKRYAGSGTAMLDLIQEGNLGLMRAVEKFDHRRGFKFSTYATWWIRQAIARGFCEQGRTIRIPVHVVEAIQRVRKHQRALFQQLGRNPTIEELATLSELTPEKVVDLLRLADEPISLDLRVGDGEQGDLADLIVDDSTDEPLNELGLQALRREVDQLLRVVGAREQHVLSMRFGLRGLRPHTLEEVGNELGVTRERARQIEARALARIRSTQSFEDFREYLQA